MKRSITSFLFVATVYTIAFAQNWMPVNLADSYNYETTASNDYYSKVLRIDSININGSDSIFYLNKVVEKCEECITPNESWCYSFVKKGVFLGEFMTKYPDGTFGFGGTVNFKLAPYASLGESWLFENKDSVYATVTSLEEGYVLGESDSIKTIELSNSKEIKLSKNHGILRFPEFSTGHYYNLVGMDTRNIGAVMPTFRDILTYVPGDVLFYKSSSGGSGSYQSFKSTSYIKAVILEAHDNFDSISYALERHVMRETDNHLNNPNISKYYYTDTLGWVVSEDELIFSEPNGYTHRESQSRLFDGIFDQKINGRGIKLTHFSLDTANQIQIFDSYDATCKIDELEFLQFEDTINVKRDLHYPYDNSDVSYILNVGIRGIFKSFSNPGQTTYSGFGLVGAILNGDTIGMVIPDSVFLEPLDSVVIQPPTTMGIGFLQPYSNIVKDNAVFMLNSPAQEELKVNLFNAVGRTVLIKKVPIGATVLEIEMEDVPNGYYFMEIRGNGSNQVVKLFKN